MTAAGQLTRRVRFRQRALDGNGDRLGPFATIVTRDARVLSLKGGEAMQAQRMAGTQWVNIYVRRDSLTKLIDNAYDAVDDRDPTIGWDLAEVTISEDLTWVQILAVQRRGEVPQ